MERSGQGGAKRKQELPTAIHFILNNEKLLCFAVALGQHHK